MTYSQRHVIARAYRDTGAFDIPCPTCGAPIGQHCTRVDDRGQTHVRRIPCCSRIQPPLDAQTVDEQPDPAQQGFLDFTEPRHPQEPR